MACNIIYGNAHQLDQLLSKTPVMKCLIERATNDQWIVRKEALWALCGICFKGDKYIIPFVQAGGLLPLVTALSVECNDESFECEILDAIRKILEKGKVSTDHGFAQEIEELDGVQYLENYNDHPGELAYQKAISILEDFFGGEIDEDENLAPATTKDGKFFDFGIENSNFKNGERFSFRGNSTNVECQL
jgi:hypothetical protein